MSNELKILTAFLCTVPAVAALAEATQPAASTAGFELVWSRHTASAAAVDALVIDNGIPMVFCADGSFERLRLADGNAFAQVHLGIRAAHAPVISSGKAVIASAQGQIGCFDLRKATCLWMHNGNGGPVSEPSIQGPVIYAGLGGSTPGVIGLDFASGDEVFSWRLSQPVLSPPLIYGDRLWVAGLGGTVYALEPYSGHVLDSVSTKGEFYNQRLAMAGQRLLFSPGGYHRRVECLSLKHPLGQAPLWSMSFNRPAYFEAGLVEPALYKRPAVRRAMMKQTIGRETGVGFDGISDFIPTGPVRMSSWVVDGKQAAVVVRESGIPPRALYHVLLVDIVTGEESVRVNRLLESTSSLTCVDPILTESSVIACVGKNTIIRVNRASGDVEWEYPVPDAEVKSVAISGDHLFVQTAQGGVMAFQARAPVSIPARFALRQNMPNPFSRLTTIRYEIPRPTRVSLEVFDSRGRLVRVLERERRQPGYYALDWDGTDNEGNELGGGLYVLRIRAAAFTKSMRMTIVR